MKIRSVRINYGLNLIRMISNTLFLVITMPYINKVLGAENLGKVEYINTVINYFLLFSALGIPMYGVREIAKVRDNVIERTKTVIELLLILGSTSLLSYALLFGILYQLNLFQNYRELILLMSSMILFTNIGAEWYFQGMEDQMYITIRYVIIRFIALFLLYYLVRSSEDYIYYALVLALTICVSNLFNIIYLFKTIEFKKIKIYQLNFKKHLKPVLTIFVATISINIYLQLDNFLIGSIVGDKYVGYYSVSNKLIRYAISFITILGSVLLPRLSNLYLNDKEQYFKYLNKTFNFILLFSLPFSVLFLVFASNIINLMAGSEFEPSILTMRILAPLCTIVGIAYFIGYLVLYTQNREIVYTKAVIYSAIFSILVNYFAIYYFKQNGAAVIAVLAELLAVAIMIFLAKDELREIQLLDKNTLKTVSALLIMLMFGVVTNLFLNDNNFLILLSTIFSIISFYGSLFFLRERNLLNILLYLKLSNEEKDYN